MLQGVILARCAYLGDQGSGTDVDESSSVIGQGQGDQGSPLRLEFVVKLRTSSIPPFSEMSEVATESCLTCLCLSSKG